MYHISHQGPATNLRLRLRSPSLSTVTRLSLDSNFASRLVFIKWSGSGDGEIRTLDPLLARQVLSQLSYTPTKKVSLILLFGLKEFKPMGLSGPFPICSWLSLLYLNELKWAFPHLLMVVFGLLKWA